MLWQSIKRCRTRMCDISRREPVAELEKGIISMNRQKLSFSLVGGVPETAHLKSIEECVRLYRESIGHPEGFWRLLAEQSCWFETWDMVLLDALANGEHQWFSYARLNTCHNPAPRCLKTWRKKEAAATLLRFELRVFVFATLTMLFWLLAPAFLGIVSREGSAADAPGLWHCLPRPDPCSPECNGWEGSFADSVLSVPAVAVMPHAIIRLG
jgi:hypothetical protein